MFEALFILTTIDAGTRVGRYLLQDALGVIWKPLRETRSLTANIFASVLMVSAWGYFLIQGVVDPLGGINSLWPLFGIANQLLAAIALCLGTTIILKMQLATDSSALRTPHSMPRGSQTQAGALGRPWLALVTLVPLVWLLTVTMTAGVQKIFHSDPRIGFLSQASELGKKQDLLERAVAIAKAGGSVASLKDAEEAARKNRVLRFNNLLDAAVAGAFLILVGAIIVLSLREWILLLARRKLAVLRETDPVWLPDYAVAEARPLHVLSLIGLAFALAKELSGEAQMERARETAAQCECHGSEMNQMTAHGENSPRDAEKELYLTLTEKRFKGIRRCC
jgi:carbon starvation protein